MNFRVILHNQSGTPQAELHKVRNVKWAWVLNGMGAAEIVLETSDPRATARLMTRAPLVAIYSEAGNWGGVLKRRIAQNGTQLTLSAWSNERLLHRRITDKARSLDGKTNGVIAQTLLQDANAVWPTGVTVGTIYTGGLAHYYEMHYDDLLERLQDMAATDNHDFEVTWDRRLNWYERKGSDRPNVVLAEGRNVVAYPAYAYIEDDIVNYQVCVGSGTTWAEKLTATEQDSASQNAYTLQQRADDFGSITEQPTLDLRAATLLSSRKDPKEAVDLIVVDRPKGLWASFREGDRVRVILPSYNLDQGFDSVVRVLGREVNAAQGTMRVIVEVGG